MGLLEGLLDLLYGTSLALADGSERAVAFTKNTAIPAAKGAVSWITTKGTDYVIDTFVKNLNKDPDKYKEKIVNVDHDGFLNFGSIALPKADVERLLAALNLIGMNSMKSSMATYFNTDAKIISFDIANYYIDKLTRYNNRNSIGIDPVINSAFKGQIRVNNFIIKNLRIYTTEKTSFKKYQQKKPSINHKKYLTEILSSLKKMYNSLYVIYKKIDGNNIDRFSSKKAFAYYLNTYTPDDKITPDEVSKKVETWDDSIKDLKNIIKNTLDNDILPDLKTIKNQIDNPLIDDPTSDDANNLKNILDILDKYSNPNGTAKKSPPYNPKGKKDIKEKIKKFGSKVIGNISLQGANYFLNLSNNILLDSRMLLCPYIVTCTAPSDRKAVSPSIPNYYLGFKTAKDITDFLKEYNDISYKLSDDWLRYIDIPNQRALNKNLISKLEEYRSVKYKIEKTLNSEKINPKDLINVKIDLKKRLEKIKKICEDKRIESYGWKSEKLKKDYEIAMDSKNTSFPEGLKEKIKTLKNTFDFMKKSCDKNVSMLWEDYIKAIGEITENTIEGIDKIIALNKNSDDTEEIKVNFDILQMKKIEYKILQKKDLDKKININEHTNAADIEGLFEKDRYKESYEINVKNKKFTKLEQSLNNKYQEQDTQINNTITNILIEYTYFEKLLSLINLLTTENSSFNKEEKKKKEDFFARYKSVKEACDKIKEDYAKYMGKNSTAQALEIALTLKNNIKMQKKYIVKLNDLYKEIIGYNKNLMEELLEIQKEFKKQKNKYDSAYKTFTKYINKHGIQSDIPYKNNDIFIKDWGKIKKEKIERIIQNLKKPVENAKKELENLQLDQKLKLNDKNLEQYKKSYRAYLSRIVDFLDKEIKKTIDLNELLRHK